MTSKFNTLHYVPITAEQPKQCARPYQQRIQTDLVKKIGEIFALGDVEFVIYAHQGRLKGSQNYTSRFCWFGQFPSAWLIYTLVFYAMRSRFEGQGDVNNLNNRLTAMQM